MTKEIKHIIILLPPYLVYGSIIALCLRWASQEFSTLWIAATMVGGWFFWTLVEYLLHRFGFHELPGRPLAKRYDIHWIHHRLPHNPKHIVTSLWLTLPLAAVFFIIFWAVGGGSPLVGAWYAGFGIGYLMYETIHYLIHVRPHPPFKFLRGLWKYHYRHHFQDDSRYYGVTTRWWDYVFGTA
ncbi:MAG: sterol desaturase family protein [Bacteroidia bacterium]|nr:sterol desaturase family protein [Bacteroidia bacterium]